ncbi:MAG: WhiB family transcriptional regulator [Ilumatobacteraceae bacterium]|jgi:WhiB family redox-sensing transcriptional regulator|nr:WhiB family transcriptional regulator [Chitinophagales bacterium]
MSEYSERFYKVIKQAACHGVPSEWFFPKSVMEDEDKTNTARAREICNSCPIIKECYEHSIRHEEFGFWAALSPRQRRAIRRHERISFESFTTQALTWQINWNTSLKRAGRAEVVRKQREAK